MKSNTDVPPTTFLVKGKFIGIKPKPIEYSPNPSIVELHTKN